MSAATARIVVQVVPAEKRALVAKAKALAIPIAELMRRGAQEYQSVRDEDLEALAEAAWGAAERCSAAIDDALTYIRASNKRIDKIEQLSEQMIRPKSWR